MRPRLAPRPISEIRKFPRAVYYGIRRQRSEADVEGWMSDVSPHARRWHDVEVGPHDAVPYQWPFCVEFFVRTGALA